MAVYRFEAKIIGRSAGRSATASAAYRAAERIEDVRTSLCFDYTRKRGVLHTEILTPAGTPDWMRDRAQLWNAVEAVEKRKDAQLARDLVLSLPCELTHEQRVALVREFVKEEFVSQGMIADFAIHAPDRRSDDRNHHAHVMLTMRALTASGFGEKVRDWNDPQCLERWREQWARHTNRHLEQHGHAARVDHRSLADQGLDREPEPKQGPVATQMERQGRRSHAGTDRRAARARNRRRGELERELSAINGEIISLDAERKRRGRGVKRAAIATTDGGMVAQQREAQRRFERNSERLENLRQRRARKSPPAKATGGDADAAPPRDTGEAKPSTFIDALDRHLKAQASQAQDRDPVADRTSPAQHDRSQAGPAAEPAKSPLESFREKLDRQRQDRERDRSPAHRSRDRDPER